MALRFRGYGSMLPLVTTKLTAPLLNQAVVTRSSLVATLEAGAHCKLLLVCAPAGFGKTHTVAAWLCPDQHTPRPQQAKPTAWYALDPTDNFTATFVAYLVAAIESVYPSSCPETARLLGAPQLPPPHYIAGVLNSELTRLPDPLYLVLDDYHHIHDLAIHNLVGALLDHLPPHVHLVLTARTPPPLRLARLRANLEMVELRAADLCFSSDEAQTLLERSLGRPLATGVLETVMDQTAGWAAALRLTALAMRAQADDTVLLQEMQQSGNEFLFDYLLEEILPSVPDQTQEFLLKTALLPELLPDLCDAVVGGQPQSAAILAGLARDQFFVLPIQRGRRAYRYHRQFQLFLRRRLLDKLSEAEIAQLHRRAAQWHVQAGNVEAAIHAYLAAGDSDAAATTLLRSLPAVYKRNSPKLVHILESLLRPLTQSIIEQHPALLMTVATLAEFRGDNRLIARSASLARRLIEQGKGPVDAAALQGLLGEILVAELYASRYSDGTTHDMETNLAACHEALALLPQTHIAIRSTLYVAIARHYRMLGRAPQGARFLEQTLADHDADHPSESYGLLNALSQLHLYTAHLDKSQEYAHRLFSRSNASGHVIDEGIGRILLAILACQRGRLADAAEHSAYVHDNPYMVHFTGQLIFAYYQIWSFSQTATVAEHQDLVSRLRTLALEFGSEETLPVIAALSPFVDLMQGNTEAATRWAEFTPMPPLHDSFPIMRLIWARCHLANGSPDVLAQTEPALQELLEFCTRHDNQWFALETKVLLSLLAHLQGRTADAQQLLAETLTFGVPRGFRLVYQGYGPTLQELLSELCQASWSPSVAAHARLILALNKQPQPTAAPQPRSTPLKIDSLTPRELDVLHLLAQNHSNHEIAQRLVLSPHTVRNHVVNICQKLGAGKRRDAVTRARDLGILPSH